MTSISELTAEFRLSQHSYWSDLRSLVAIEMRLHPETVAIADKWPDEDSDIVVLVTAQDAFEADYQDASSGAPTLLWWNRLEPGTDVWRGYEAEIRSARQVLDADHAGGD